MIFYVSELFFGNENIARNRHFHNADSMNIRIIENWNSIVTQNDIVYIIGGVGQFEFLLSLNGEKIVMLSPYEHKFYNDYIDSVTTDRDDEYNEEMFSVYLGNMFYVKETIHERYTYRRDYAGNMLRLSTINDIGREKERDYYTIYGAIGEYYRAVRGGINSNIYVNGLFPLSEGEVESIRKQMK